MQKIKNSRKKSLLIQYMLECKVCLGQSIICKNEVHPPLYIYMYIYFQLYIKKVGLKMMSWCITSCNFKNKFLLLSNVKKKMMYIVGIFYILHHHNLKRTFFSNIFWKSVSTSQISHYPIKCFREQFSLFVLSQSN